MAGYCCQTGGLMLPSPPFSCADAPVACDGTISLAPAATPTPAAANDPLLQAELLLLKLRAAETGAATATASATTATGSSTAGSSSQQQPVCTFLAKDCVTRCGPKAETGCPTSCYLMAGAQFGCGPMPEITGTAQEASGTPTPTLTPTPAATATPSK